MTWQDLANKASRMARLRRAVPLLLALLLGACAGDDGAPTVSLRPSSAPFRLADADRTTTSSVTAPVVRPHVERASRAARAQRPAPPVVLDHAGELPPIMLRIRWCESRNNYTAENRHSSASGAWQFLDSSWAKYAGYERAMYAPPEVQDQKALNVYNSVGTRPWNASRSCWG